MIGKDNELTMLSIKLWKFNILKVTEKDLLQSFYSSCHPTWGIVFFVRIALTYIDFISFVKQYLTGWEGWKFGDHRWPLEDWFHHDTGTPAAWGEVRRSTISCPLLSYLHGPFPLCCPANTDWRSISTGLSHSFVLQPTNLTIHQTGWDWREALGVWKQQ